MKRLVPTEFELSLKADREHAARGAALHKQKPLAVNIHDDKQRIRELEAALKPFSHPDLCKTFGGNIEGDESIVFQRAGAVLKLGHFRRVAALLNGGGK